MRKTPKGSPLWKYLEACGVLENGTDEQIIAAKRQYRKNYLHHFKQKQRKAKPGFTVMLSKENGQYDTISLAAKKHSLAITAFLREATLAYIHQYYIVPDRMQVARLEQFLAQYLNEVQRIAPVREKYSWEWEQKYEAIEKRIVAMQMQIKEALSNPPLASNHDSQNKIT
jgi:hypothetical protein